MGDGSDLEGGGGNRDGEKWLDFRDFMNLLMAWVQILREKENLGKTLKFLA